MQSDYEVIKVALFIGFCAGVGSIIGDAKGAAVGAVLCMGILIIADVLEQKK